MWKEDFSKSDEKPRELCFDKNEFLKDSFSVDEFLREHRNHASLEVMRDDLGIHLKTLRLSMIELINKDYEDFVNLSKDLVGLDNGIRKIQIPLEQIKNEVLEVKMELEEAISGFSNCLEQRREITDKKKSLIYLTQVITCINKLKNIMEINKGSQKDFSMDLIERAAMEFNQLEFSVLKCDRDLLDSKKKEAEDIRKELMVILSNKFLECLKKKKIDELVTCLKIYAELGKIQELETLVRVEVVAPKLAELITEQALQREPDGISYVYDEIINFIKADLRELLEVTSYREMPPSVKGFSFIINSIWPELEERLNLPLMFAPGNPKVFHSRFTKSVELLRKLEIMCGSHSSVRKLRQNWQYQHFFQKWNLPVYFKIRFQEIAGQLEKILGEINIGNFVSTTENAVSYHLKSSSAVIGQITKCWRDDVYLKELSHMFWKLSLQILSRYTVWLRDLLSKESEFLEKRKIELGTLQTSFGMENLQVRSRLDFLVCLFRDTNKLLMETGKFLEDCKRKIPNRQLIEEELETSLRESLNQVGEILPTVSNFIVKLIVQESAVHFRQVSQIPRLFRRTNRKSSTEPCEYVGQVLNFPRQFREWKKNFFLTWDSPSDSSSFTPSSWWNSILDELTEEFYLAVNEVLTNAQKTEESLRKLKRKKENNQGRTSSGDEEIRQQLVIDVHSFCHGVEEGFEIRKENVKMLNELVELVETARDKSGGQ